MDSLTSLEFKNRLETTLGLRFSVATIWNYPTISKLVVYLADMLGVSLGEGENFAGNANQTDDDIAGALHDLSDEELAALAAEDMD
jgi:myxalamid-type polyketide synthase MxaF